MAWMQDIWSGFAAGTVYTGDVTHPESTARAIQTVTQAVTLCGASTFLRNRFRVAMQSSLPQCRPICVRRRSITIFIHYAKLSRLNLLLGYFHFSYSDAEFTVSIIILKRYGLFLSNSEFKTPLPTSRLDFSRGIGVSSRLFKKTYELAKSMRGHQ
jgi:hypothetical protein